MQCDHNLDDSHFILFLCISSTYIWINATIYEIEFKHTDNKSFSNMFQKIVMALTFKQLKVKTHSVLYTDEDKLNILYSMLFLEKFI